MIEFDPLPDDLKRSMFDAVFEFAGKHLPGSLGEQVRGLSSQEALRRALDEALQRGIQRFEQEYIEIDEDLVQDLLDTPDLWHNAQIRTAIITLVSNPGSLRDDEHAQIVVHFETVLPRRRNRQRVDRALSYLLRVVAQEVWAVPGAKEIRDLTMLQMQRVNAESAQQQVALLRAHLNATTQLGDDIRQVLLQFTGVVEQKLLEAPRIPTSLPSPRPYHNLPQPDYARFVGREREWAWLRQRLAPQDRAWQMALTGIGGVGKSALALAIAHDYRTRYHDLPPDERFEAIIWVSGKQEVLTPEGKEAAGLPGLTFRTLQDIYTAIAQTLEREDITRAAPAHQTDIFALYEAGLNELLQRLGPGHHFYDESLVYEQRLTENIANYRRYGDSPERKTERAEIIDHLNDIAVTTLGISFNDICEQQPAPGSQEQDRLVHKALTNQRTLLLVDNLESITDRRVRLFLRNLPAPTKAIITSREWVDVADVLRMTGLTATEADQYIAAEATMREVNLDAAQRQRIFDLTAGLPLPIKLSIARMSSGESFDAVMRWLGDATGDLPEYCVKGLSELLREREPHAWHLLLACTLFDRDAGASREALGAVANLSLADRDNGLARLMRFSLINRTDEDRFWLMPIVQRYAGAILDNSELEQPMVERWLAWLVDFAETWGVDMESHINHIKIFGLEYDNLYNAIRICEQQEKWHVLQQLAVSTRYYAYLVSLLADCQEILNAAIKAAQASNNKENEGTFKVRLAQLLIWGFNKYDPEHLRSVEKFVEQNCNEVQLGRIRIVIADTICNQKIDEAEKLVHKVMEMGVKLNNTRLKTLAAVRLSNISAKKQHFDEALTLLKQAKQWANQMDWYQMQAFIEHTSGLNSLEQLNYKDAEDAFIRSMEIAISLGDRRREAFCKEQLVKIYLVTGRYILARQVAEEARDIFERIGISENHNKMNSLIRQLQTDDPLLHELLTGENT